MVVKCFTQEELAALCAKEMLRILHEEERTEDWTYGERVAFSNSFQISGGEVSGTMAMFTKEELAEDGFDGQAKLKEWISSNKIPDVP